MTPTAQTFLNPELAGAMLPALFHPRELAEEDFFFPLLLRSTHNLLAASSG